MDQVTNPRCVFTEGSIALPADYIEQTVNILIAPQKPSLNISRDRLENGESFEAWLARQREMLQKGLRGYEALDEQPLTLNAGQLQGISLLSSYQPQKDQTCYQRQAVFPLPGGAILIFTLASPQPLTEQDEALFTNCLQSYQQP